MKITRKQLSELIREEYEKQNKLSFLKEEKLRIEQELAELKGFDDYTDPASTYVPIGKVEDCPVCKGSGEDPDVPGEECYYCDGTGEVLVEPADEDPAFERDAEGNPID